MKALTIWQPWATLIAIGAKPYEFRSWPAPAYVRGTRIAIHAGSRPLKLPEVRQLLTLLGSERHRWVTCLRPELAVPLLERAMSEPTILPHSAVLCTGMIGQPVRGYDVIGEFVGQPNDSDRDQHSNWAWPITDIEVLTPPVEARGAQGFWNWGGA